MRTEKVAVTGITGHSGGFFLRHMDTAGYDGSVRALVRDKSDTSHIDASRLRIEKAYGDLDDMAFLISAFSGCDVVLHIAHIKFSEKVVEAAIRAGVKRCILVHTTGRYSRYKSASAGYVAIDEAVLAARGKIAITILRPTMIYGSSRDRNMFKLVDYLYRHRFFPIFGKGQSLMQPVHARDLGIAYYSVLMNPEITANREYNLSGGDALPYIDIVRIVSTRLRRKVTFIYVPIGISIFLARIYNALVKDARISVEQVMRMQEDKIFSHEMAKADFGYTPVNFASGISEEVDEYLSMKGVPRSA